MRWRRSGPWARPEFGRLWAAHTVSRFGSQVTALALPLAAVTTLDATPFQVGLLVAAGTAPVPLFGLFAGVWADRRARRPTMVAADVGRVGLLLLVPLAAWAGMLRIEVLCAVAFLAGTLGVLFDVASQALVTDLVERRDLVEANSALQSSGALAEVAGPGLAGGLVGAVGAPFALLADALSFALSALLLRGIRAEEARPAPAAWGARGVLRDIGEGLRLVAGDPILRTLAGSTGTWNLFENARWAMLVPFLARDLGLGSAAIGLAIGTASVGWLLGTLLPARAARRFGLGRAMLGATWVTFAGGLLVAAAGGPPAVALAVLVAGLFVEGLAGPTYDANQLSVRQAVSPERARGRVNATTRVLIRGTVPLGALLGGAVAGAFGLRAAIVLGALGPPAALLWLWRSPVRGLEAVPGTPEESPSARPVPPLG